MSNSFSALKKSRSKSLENLNKKLTEMTSGGYSNPDEDKYWQPSVDKAGNGFAVIRFLPAPEGEDIPFVRLWSHGFQSPVTNRWYIENCRSTINEEDPVNDLNSELWNSGNDEDKETVRRQKRRLNYISNIYVVKDPSNPDNEGKVFLFKYGKKIFDKLNDMTTPEYEGADVVNPFDMWEGANFRLKIRKVEGYRNYDLSNFDSPEALKDDDDELEAIWKQEHSLQEIIDPKNFKSYDELKAKLDAVLGKTPSRKSAKTAEDEVDNFAESNSGGSGNFDLSDLGGKSDPEPEKKEKAAPAPKAQAASIDDEDDDLAFFKSLADSDEH